MTNTFETKPKIPPSRRSDRFQTGIALLQGFKTNRESNKYWSKTLHAIEQDWEYYDYACEEWKVLFEMLEREGGYDIEEEKMIRLLEIVKSIVRAVMHARVVHPRFWHLWIVSRLYAYVPKCVRLTESSTRQPRAEWLRDKLDLPAPRHAVSVATDLLDSQTHSALTCSSEHRSSNTTPAGPRIHSRVDLCPTRTDKLRSTASFETMPNLSGGAVAEPRPRNTRLGGSQMLCPFAALEGSLSIRLITFSFLVSPFPLPHTLQVPVDGDDHSAGHFELKLLLLFRVQALRKEIPRSSLTWFRELRNFRAERIASSTVGRLRARG